MIEMHYIYPCINVVRGGGGGVLAGGTLKVKATFTRADSDDYFD